MPRSTTPAVVVSPKTCWRPCLYMPQLYVLTPCRRHARVTWGSVSPRARSPTSSVLLYVYTNRQEYLAVPAVSRSYIFPPQLAIGWAPPRPCAGRVSAGQRFRGRAVVAPVPPPGHRLIRSPSTGESEQVAERRAQPRVRVCVWRTGDNDTWMLFDPPLR
jgi:hypothetical protein